MTDPFDIETPRQQAYVLLALVAYFVLFVIDILTANPTASALSDLVIGALAIPASLVIVRRAMALAETDWIAVGAGAAFFVAGVTIGYDGVAALTDLPSVLTVQTVGSAALLVGLVLYLYRSWR